MSDINGECVACGARFTTNQPERRYCCQSCRQRHKARQRRAAKPPTKRKCSCGTTYVKQNNPEAGNKYCSAACRKAVAVHGRAINCVVCGKHYEAPNYRTVACPDCAEGYRKQRRKGAIYTPKCVACGEPFTARGGNAKRCPACQPPPTPPKSHLCDGCGTPGVQSPRRYCSEKCKTQTRLTRAGKRITDLYALACSAGVGGTRWRQQLIALLTERDGPHCQICGGLINYKRRSGPRGHPSGTGPSIDHIHPRSLNGADDLDNLRLTHWKCNRAKKATTAFGAPQLALEYTT